MIIQFNSSKDVISKHKPLFDRVVGKNAIDTFVLSGGRSSFKSYDICLAIVIDMLFHAKKGQQANSVVFMQKKEEIRDGVLKQFETVIEDLGLSDLFSRRYQPFEIKLNSNGSVVKFYGLNKQQGKKANAIDNISWIWFEEFDQFESQETVEPTLDTFMRHAIKDERIKIVYSFNPPRSNHHWVFEYLRKLDAERIHTTYLDDDTGKNLLPTQLLEKIEATKMKEPAWYTWNYLGIVPDSAEVDFPSPIKATEALQLDENDFIFAGVDSATKGVDSTVVCLLAYNSETKRIKLIGFQKFDDVWQDGYTSYKVGSDINALLMSVNCNAVYIDPADGQHIIDYIITQNNGISVASINFGSRISEDAKGKTLLALNKRAEMYLNVSEQLRNKNVVAYCECNELIKQLDATEFEMTSKQIKVIDKKIIKARVGHSPDEADSFVLGVQAIYDFMRL